MFSKTTEYALRAVIFIAQKSSEEQKLSLQQVAEAIDSPPSFTAKILQVLTGTKKLVSSSRGPNGGFYMTEKNKNQPVRSILEIMGEYRVLEKCVLGLDKCTESNPCPMHAQYKLIKTQIIDLFQNKTIATLAAETNAGKVFINNKKKKAF